MDGLQIIGLVALVVYGCAVAYLFVQVRRDRPHSSVELREDLDEVTATVVRLAKAARAEQMRRVRATAEDGVPGPQVGAATPTSIATPTDRATLKQQLRDRLRGQT